MQCVAMHVRNNDFTADRGADDAKQGTVVMLLMLLMQVNE